MTNPPTSYTTSWDTTEVKADQSVNRAQARADRHLGSENKLANEVVTFRIPYEEIKPHHLIKTAEDMLVKHTGDGPGQLSAAQVKDILGRLGKLYRDPVNPLPVNLAIGATARVIAHELAAASER